MKGYTSTTKGNVPKCLRKLRFVIAKKKMITSMYTANSHLTRQGEITLRIQKIKTYLPSQGTSVALRIYDFLYIYFFYILKKLTNTQANPI